MVEKVKDGDSGKRKVKRAQQLLTTFPLASGRDKESLTLYLRLKVKINPS